MLQTKSLPALEPGAIISDKYRVERVLGRGGMGVVVAATHLDLQQVFAIKILFPTGGSSAEAILRFLREGRSAARLTSPHATKVHDTGRLESGEPYLVMELLRGCDLQAHLAAVGRVPLVQTIDWIVQASHALAEAHALQIIHRDVKPANLFLAETSTGQQIKILDFGISKQLDSREVELTSTASGVGTPRYMAPEQMRSPKLADARGDVWSLGIVLYELTTGHTPFKGDSVTSLCFDVMERTPEPPSHLAAELPAAFDEIVMRCLEKDPNDRYPSVEALATALVGIAPVSQSSGQSPGVLAAGLEPTSLDVRIVPPSAPSSPHSAEPTPLGSTPSVGAPPPSVTLPLGEPLFQETTPRETLGTWNTISMPNPPIRRAQRNRLIAVGVSVGIAVATLGGMLLASLGSTGSTPPARPSSLVIGSSALSASLSTAPSAAARAPSEPVITVSDAPPIPDEMPSSITPSSSAAPSAQQAAETPPKAQRPSCVPPFTVDDRGIRIPKPQCL